MRQRTRLIVNIALLALTVGAGYFVISYRQDILDWWALRSYTAPASVKQLADDDTMVGRGRDLFYVSDPRVEDSTAFNAHCSKIGEKSLVLGCYVGQRVYVYNVTDTRLAGVTQVTAAHEMLHAAYERLGAGAKAKLDAMLQTEIAKITDDRLKELINLYNTSEPGQLLNEMHSILGTEYAGLSPNLENYYRQYFSDRSKVVAFASGYESVFTTSKQRIGQLEAQLNDLKKQIDDSTAGVIMLKDALNAKAQELNNLRANDKATYNKEVPIYNEQVRVYNAAVIKLRSLVDTYNNLVVAHNNEAAAQTDLYHSLDSHYQTVAN